MGGGSQMRRDGRFETRNGGKVDANTQSASLADGAHFPGVVCGFDQIIATQRIWSHGRFLATCQSVGDHLADGAAIEADARGVTLVEFSLVQ